MERGTAMRCRDVLKVVVLGVAIAVPAAIGQLRSDGVIHNYGRLVIKGNAQFRQDTLGGTVVYAWDRTDVNQYIPHLVYEDVRFRGRTRKMLLDSLRALVALRRVETDTGVTIRLVRQSAIVAHGETRHQGIINPDFLFGRVVLQGQQPQDISGRGLFRELELDNPAGADVREGGGFTVSTRLELKRGILRNTAQNNFRIGDSAWIVRSPEGGLATAPEFGTGIGVRYVGTGQIRSGPELPEDSTRLRALVVENSGGLVLERSVTVSDSLVLAAPIWTEPDSSRRNVLTYSSELGDPVFLHPDAEIIGTLRRTRLRTDGRPVVFNNPYTYLQPGNEGWGRLAQLSVRVLPRTQPWYPQGERKVARVLQILGWDATGQMLWQAPELRMGYGWRHAPGDPMRDETRGLPLPALELQRWTDEGWFSAGQSLPPQVDSLVGWAWAYSYADKVFGLGDFAIGVRDDARALRIQLAALLEGPYRNGSMVDDLRQRGWLPETPPDIYPYNLDPTRPNIRVNSIPDSVVDWVVVELRTLLSGGERYYRTAFLLRDGRIVDLDGKTPLMLPGVQSGSYYVAIHHRNHLAIITAEPVWISPETQRQVLAMTQDPARILGGAGALRALRRNGNGNGTIWAMIGGDVNGDGQVDEADLELLRRWQQLEGYDNADADLSGIVTTRDFNMAWNNRGKRSVVGQ